MRILDLFCGEGGAGYGYHLAGFEVVGVDRADVARHYPFEFIRADVRDLDADFVAGFDAVHASPPCQAHSTLEAVVMTRRGRLRPRVDMVPSTRALLVESGRPYVIENVPGAPLVDPVMLCGSSFGLPMRRHRLFETNWPLSGLDCDHGSITENVGVYGNFPFAKATAQEAMGMHWGTRHGLTQAVPPAMTRHIGEQLAEHLDAVGTLSA